MRDKLDLLMLNNDEKLKIEEKFLATLSLISFEELREVQAYLQKEGVNITKAREIKVLANSKDEIAKKFSILNEIHETDIYRNDATMINRNVIDIYKKIQYCKQIGKKYRREDGTYEPFLFSEKLWQEAVSKSPVMNIEEVNTHLEESPKIEGLVKEEVKSEPEEAIDTDKYMDIKEYNNQNHDIDELDAKTTDFATIRKELEGQLAELDALSNGIEFNDEISFADLEPESYGMGRAS